MSKVPQRMAPRISCTKLGEYMVASPTRRRRILEDQKFPSGFIVPLYADAQEVISGYLQRGGNNVELVEQAIDRLLRSVTNWTAPL